MRKTPETVEQRVEALLRQVPVVVPALSLLTAAGLYAGVGAYCSRSCSWSWELAMRRRGVRGGRA